MITRALLPTSLLLALALGAASPSSAAPPPSTSTPAPPSTTPAPSTPSTPAAPASTSTAPKRALRIAVKAIDAPDPALASVLTDAVVAELRKLERLSVIGLDEVQAMLDLEAQKQLAGCSESSCIAEIAAALGADILVVGSVNRVDDGAVFALKRLEQIEAAPTAKWCSASPTPGAKSPSRWWAPPSSSSSASFRCAWEKSAASTTRSPCA
jgi:hypothetical protein